MNNFRIPCISRIYMFLMKIRSYLFIILSWIHTLPQSQCKEFWVSSVNHYHLCHTIGWCHESHLSWRISHLFLICLSLQTSKADKPILDMWQRLLLSVCYVFCAGVTLPIILRYLYRRNKTPSVIIGVFYCLFSTEKLLDQPGLVLHTGNQKCSILLMQWIINFDAMFVISVFIGYCYHRMS